ncbi:DUF3693 domain-containing protein [Xanthomonas citri]|nr:DUF3693 domain-containing protein [Xanthomonas citri]
MALIHLAQADPAIAVLVRTEGAESPEAKKAWSVVWDRLSPVTTVIGALALVAIGMHAGTHEALLTALSPVALTAPSIHYAKLAASPYGGAAGHLHCSSSTRQNSSAPPG